MLIRSALLIAALAITAGASATPTGDFNERNFALVLAAKADTGCPCNGNKLCTGPRGGRYCITSGGNKRYTK